MLASAMLSTLFLIGTTAWPIMNGKLVGVKKGGVMQRDGAFPFMVFLRVVEENKVGFCGGVLVRRDVVLTAAHCLVSCKSNLNIRAIAGVLDLDNDKGQEIHSVGFKIHEQFGGVNPDDPKFGHNDIALVWLRAKFTLDENVKLATLPKLPVKMLNNFGTVMGWGLTESHKRSKLLKKTELKVISKQKCVHDIPEETFNGKSFCAKSTNGLDGACRGDSGGPFIFNGIVRGILSFSGSEYIVDKNGKTKLRCQPNIPQIFTDVSAYYEWIQTQIERKDNDADKMPGNIRGVCLNSPVVYREIASPEDIKHNKPSTSKQRRT